MSIFGKKSIEEIANQVESLLDTYKGDLQKGLDLCEKKFTVSFAVTIEPAETSNTIETKIRFVKEKISDSIKESTEEASEPVLKQVK